MSLKKFFKIFELRPDFYGVYRPSYTMVETHFFSLNLQPTHEECEKMVEKHGVLTVQYAIVEVFEREVQ